MRFDRVAVLDWSAARGRRQGKDSIWLGLADAGGVTAINLPTRTAAEAHLAALAAGGGGRLLIGVDFALGYPAGVAGRLTGQTRALALWDWLARRVHELPGDGSNYRVVAAEANRAFPGEGPFWGNGERAETIGLPRTRPDLPAGIAAHRATERAARAGGSNPKPVWQLAGAGAVGAQAMTGIPVLHRLRGAHPGRVAVWPFEPRDGAEVVLAEVYPSLLADAVRADPGTVPDEVQVRLLARALHELAQGEGMADLMARRESPAVLEEEGWILGVGAEPLLRSAAVPLTPPRLRNDCFAMPQGVAWVPVEDALDRLRTGLSPVIGTERLPVAQGLDRILAEAPMARRANPPAPNAAVDGYGFAVASTGHGVQRLPLVAGRAAAGQPFAGAVPPGQAIRILTGAILPAGVDTVVLEEDCATDGATVAFDGPAKPRSNTRRIGEDVAEGAALFAPGHCLRAPDLALLAATGVAEVTLRRSLRVAVLSTGDEVVTGAAAAPHQMFDANRPMLLALAQGWGFDVLDLGAAPDDADAIAARLDAGAAGADAILTTGGASAGDEDHVSRLLRARGDLQSWRIAMKPGRPLALALWRGVPVFGLPGNPVAALVCALIFARPALGVLAGGDWQAPLGFTVPAAFAKRKKPGRREYLRARLTPQGAAEVFASEGSGRISGLAWATGLVELPDGAADIEPGTPVRFLPYAGFGI